MITTRISPYLLLGTLALTGAALNASAQTYQPPAASATDRVPAGGSPASGVRNTGTDAKYSGGGGSSAKRVQAMVWDNNVSGGRIDFSWVVNRNDPPASHTIRIQPTLRGATLSDPDVTLAYQEDNNGLRFYANIVYLQTVNGVARTYWDVYAWDNANETFSRKPGFPVALGGVTRSHSSPNIDANSTGQVAIVWQEASTESSTVQVVSPSIPNPGLIYGPTPITMAESFVLPAFIDGSLSGSCHDYRGIQVAADAANPSPPILFNQSLTPDVAVGSFGTVSVVYINSLAVPNSSPVAEDVRVVIKQFRVADNCQMSLVRVHSWDRAHGASVGTPRITMRQDGDTEVQVALDWKQTVCEPGYGTRTYREIRNFGTDAIGEWRAYPITVSPSYVVGVNTTEVTAPVISYYGFDSQDYYNITWTAANYPQNASGRDLWARTLTGGTLVNGSYFRINTNLTGNQQTASVACRYDGRMFGAAYLFFDEALGRMHFKDVGVSLGVGPVARSSAAAAGAAQQPAPIITQP
jgi:hypothetical protein